MSLEKTDIIKLLKAGVDGSVIAGLLEDDQSAGNGPRDKPAAVPDVETPVENVDNSAPAPAPEVSVDKQDQILAAINRLTGAIQVNNILNSGAAGEPESAENILSYMLNGKQEN